MDTSTLTPALQRVRGGKLDVIEHKASIDGEGNAIDAWFEPVVRPVGKPLQRFVGVDKDGVEVWAQYGPATTVTITDDEADRFRATVTATIDAIIGPKGKDESDEDYAARQERAKALPQDKRVRQALMERLLLNVRGLDYAAQPRGRSAAADPLANVDFAAFAAKLGLL